jgi:hypothetical protein
MFLKSKFLRVSLAFALLLSFALLVFGDTIRLKDGSIVKGRVIGFKDGQFVIVIGEGARQRQMNYYADEIAAIEFDTNTNPANSSKVAVNNTPQPTPTPIVNNNPPASNENVKVVGNNDSTKPNDTQTVPVSTKPNNTKASGIQINSKVLADNTSNGWTNTGWVVKKGQRIRISGTGRISIGNGRYATPSGVASIPDSEKLLKEKPTGGLIAVIGDDNNDFIFIGGSNEFVATRDGALFLGINEGYLDDNSGAFDVVVEIDPLTNNGN